MGFWYASRASHGQAFILLLPVDQLQSLITLLSQRYPNNEASEAVQCLRIDHCFRGFRPNKEELGGPVCFPFLFSLLRSISSSSLKSLLRAVCETMQQIVLGNGCIYQCIIH